VVGEGLRQKSDFLLDTGIIIRYLRRKKQAADLLDYLEKIGDMSVSAITYMEILINCRPDEEQATLLFFDRVPPVAISSEVAQKAATLIKKYPEVFGKNNPRGFPDALIAATAWQRGSALVTLNTRHYIRVPMSEFRIQPIDQNAPNWVDSFRS